MRSLCDILAEKQTLEESIARSLTEFANKYEVEIQCTVDTTTNVSLLSEKPNRYKTFATATIKVKL